MRRLLAAAAAAGSLGLAGALGVPLLVVVALLHPSTCSAGGRAGVMPGSVTAAGLDAYLAGKGSPLSEQGPALIEAGTRHQVDPRFVVAVAGAESSFGVIVCAPFNAWGYGCPDHPARFGSWAQAIDQVSQGISDGYLAQGRTSVAAIGAKWAPVGAHNDPGNLNSEWSRNVTTYLGELGGDPGNVALAAESNPSSPPTTAPLERPAAATATADSPVEPEELGLDPRFAGLWESYRAAVHAELGVDLTIVSGFRSAAEQQAIWDSTPAERRGTWVAPPGTSNHNKGLAIDHAPNSTPQMRAIAARLGLNYPMDYEPWHVEPADARAGGSATATAAGSATGATDPPAATGCSGAGVVPDPGTGGAAGGADPAGNPGPAVLAAALSQLGRPYVWGGGDRNGPTGGGFDCSGLALYAWWQGAHVPLDHLTTSQLGVGHRIPPAQLRAGDLLFFNTTGPLGHVGISDGHGGMVHAPDSGAVVQLVPNVLANGYFGSRFAGANRPAG